MKHPLMIGLSALALVAVGGGAALAHEHGDGMKADADGNGVVTRAEAEAGATAMFAEMDSDGNGTLTPADRDARMAAHHAEMFAMLDTDKNGQISRDEFMAHKPGGMGDGKHDGAGKGMGSGHHKMGMRGHGGGKMMMNMADANSDGSITKAEFTAAAMTRFDKTDTNKDGQVSAEERKAMHEQMRAKWKEMKQGTNHDHAAS